MLQFKFEVTVTPKTATLKIDGTDQVLTDGKLMQDVEFDKELELSTELEGFVKQDQTVKIEAKDNFVAITLVKAKVDLNQVQFFPPLFLNNF